MDFEKLAENLGLEEDEYLELVKLLIETSRADLGRIEVSIREENSDEAANRLHSIKGAGGNLGLMEIYDLARQGEQVARNNDLDQLPDIVQGLKTRLNSLAEVAGI
jgi:HPt (histidine-containing phosphotransfer) domain-containing protein